MVYICFSDIHGRYRELMNCLEYFEKKYTQKKYVFLGDYCDRGPKNIPVIQELMKLPEDSIILKGNHEEFLIGSHDFEKLDENSEIRKYHNSSLSVEYIWIYPSNGGLHTLKELDALKETEREAIYEFVTNLKDRKEESNVLFTHAPLYRKNGDMDLLSYKSTDVLWNCSSCPVDKNARWNVHGHLHEENVFVLESQKRISLGTYTDLKGVVLDISENSLDVLEVYNGRTKRTNKMPRK